MPIYENIFRLIPEDHNLNSHLTENFKSCNNFLRGSYPVFYLSILLHQYINIFHTFYISLTNAIEYYG
jgi:hypothetical protein